MSAELYYFNKKFLKTVKENFFNSVRGEDINVLPSLLSR